MYCDIWGPCNELSYNGSRYFLTLVDDFSRRTWAYMLNQNLMQPVHYKTFLPWLRTNLKQKSKLFIGDNGGEFAMKKFILKKGLYTRKLV